VALDEGLVEDPSIDRGGGGGDPSLADDDARAWARRFSDISARVGRLRARGAVLPELEGRLAAAPALAAAGDHAAALRLLDELAVLSNALVSVFGPESPIRDPLHVIVDDRIDAWVKAELDRAIDKRVGVRQDELLASARLQERIDEVARGRTEELLASARLASKIEEVARKAAGDVVKGVVEEALGSKAWNDAVDARARARAEEVVASLRSATPAAKLTEIDTAAVVERVQPLIESIVRQTLTSRDTFNKAFDAHLALLRMRIKDEMARKNQAAEEEEAPDQG
jgi:hypothetical protein